MAQLYSPQERRFTKRTNKSEHSLHNTAAQPMLSSSSVQPPAPHAQPRQRFAENEHFDFNDDDDDVVGDDDDDNDLDDMLPMHESRLWENDSSYLIAVAPKLFENNRIRLKVILGYRVQSVVHGLPDEYDYEAGGGMSLMPMSNTRSRYRRRNYEHFSRLDRQLARMTPEQFNQLPESQQRRILRERYLRSQWEQSEQARLAGHGAGAGGRRRFESFFPFSWNNMQYLAMRNWDHLGWKSAVGLLAFVAGLYRTVRSFYR